MPSYKTPLPDPPMFSSHIRSRFKSTPPSPPNIIPKPHFDPSHHTSSSFNMYPTAVFTTPGAKGKTHPQQDRFLNLHTENACSVHAVFDGHGDQTSGHVAAEYCATHFPTFLRQFQLISDNQPLSHSLVHSRLRDTILDLDRSVIQHTTNKRVYSGTTLCALLRRGSHLFCVNVGDSRAILLRRNGETALSIDHTTAVPEETERVKAAGGWVVANLVNGYISMTRALGDDDMKSHRNQTPFPTTGRPAGVTQLGESLFTAEPDVEVKEIGADDLVAVIASDGVWGKLQNEAVGNIVRKLICNGKSAEQIAQAIVKRALQKGTKDNATVIVVFLHGQRYVRDMLMGSRKGRKETADASSSSGTESPVDVREISRNVGDTRIETEIAQGRFRLRRSWREREP